MLKSATCDDIFDLSLSAEDIKDFEMMSKNEVESNAGVVGGAGVGVGVECKMEDTVIEEVGGEEDTAANVVTTGSWADASDDIEGRGIEGGRGEDEQQKAPPARIDTRHIYRRTQSYEEYTSILEIAREAPNNYHIFLTATYIDEAILRKYSRTNDPIDALLRISLTLTRGVTDPSTGKFHLSENYQQKIFRVNNYSVRQCRSEADMKQLMIRLKSYFNDNLSPDRAKYEAGRTRGQVHFSERYESIADMTNAVLADLTRMQASNIHCRINGTFFRPFASYMNYMCRQRGIANFRFIRLKHFYSVDMPISQECIHQIDHSSRTCEICFVADLQNCKLDKTIGIEIKRKVA